MVEVLIYINIALALIVIFYSIKRESLNGALPTLAWLGFMVLPYLFSYRFFSESTRLDQIFGISFINVAILFGDFLSIMNQKRIKELEVPRVYKFKYFKIVISIIIFFPILHYTISGNIPLLDYIFNGFTNIEYSLNRTNFTKTSIPYVLGITSNLYVVILIPITLIFLIHMKKLVLSFLVLSWGAFYAVSSGAKGPLVMLLVSMAFAYSFSKNKKVLEKLSFVVAAAIFTSVLSGYIYGNYMLSNSTKCDVPVGVKVTPANISRSCSGDEKLSFNPIVSTLGYRVFLTPVEVSNHWYEYYKATDRNIFDVLIRQESPRASNLVGIEYYFDKFPNSYTKYINANSSIDADAFSIFGLFGVAIVALLLFGLRVYIGNQRPHSPPITKSFEGISLSLLILLPFTASLQAILFAQGLFVLILMIFSFRNQDYLHSKVRLKSK
jgi:hypothetical protein